MAYMLSLIMVCKVIIDTNVFVSAVLSANGAARAVLRSALLYEITPIFGNALLAEYEYVLGRENIFDKADVSQHERQILFEALLSVSKWNRIHFLWRPNLKDEGDNHVLELGVASGAEAIITGNTKDFKKSELLFPELLILTPSEWLNRRTTP